jgi:hypothetical protein
MPHCCWRHDHEQSFSKSLATRPAAVPMRHEAIKASVVRTKSLSAVRHAQRLNLTDLQKPSHIIHVANVEDPTRYCPLMDQALSHRFDHLSAASASSYMLDELECRGQTGTWV